MLCELEQKDVKRVVYIELQCPPKLCRQAIETMWLDF